MTRRTDESLQNIGGRRVRTEMLRSLGETPLARSYFKGWTAEEKHPRSKDGDVSRKKNGIEGAEVVVG